MTDINRKPDPRTEQDDDKTATKPPRKLRTNAAGKAPSAPATGGLGAAGAGGPKGFGTGS